MFDPFFPVAILCGPLAMALLLWIEARRQIPTFWPSVGGIALALPAVWGLHYWVILIGVVALGEGMDEAGFERLTTIGLVAAIVVLTAGYSFAYAQRRKCFAASE